MNTLATRRVHVLVRLAFVWAALIVARLIQLQVVQHTEYEKWRPAARENGRCKRPRGAILDRMGQRLAMSLPAESVCVDPLRVPDLSVAADILSKILNLDSGDLLARMRKQPPTKRGFLWVKRKITPKKPSGCAI